MEKVWFFDFETRTWSNKSCTGGLQSWSFGHAHKRGKHLLAYGATSLSQNQGSSLEVSYSCESAQILLDKYTFHNSGIILQLLILVRLSYIDIKRFGKNQTTEAHLKINLFH